MINDIGGVQKYENTRQIILPRRLLIWDLENDEKVKKKRQKMSIPGKYTRIT